MSDGTMDRRAFLEHATVGCVVLAAPRRLPGFAPGVSGPTGQLAAPFELEEVTIAALQAGLESGKYTARSLVTAYLQRIDELDRKGPTLRAVLEANPDALAQAAALDAERKAKGPRGPLHGIPVLVKDNIATRDRMQSTAGSLALAGVVPPRDAFLVERLRAAGAVLLGKANLSEWANFRSTHSSSGWSGRGHRVGRARRGRSARRGDRRERRAVTDRLREGPRSRGPAGSAARRLSLPVHGL